LNPCDFFDLNAKDKTIGIPPQNSNPPIGAVVGNPWRNSQPDDLRLMRPYAVQMQSREQDNNALGTTHDGSRQIQMLLVTLFYRDVNSSIDSNDSTSLRPTAERHRSNLRRNIGDERHVSYCCNRQRNATE
jgi:hypothetical protein